MRSLAGKLPKASNLCGSANWHPESLELLAAVDSARRHQLGGNVEARPKMENGYWVIFEIRLLRWCCYALRLCEEIGFGLNVSGMVSLMMMVMGYRIWVGGTRQKIVVDSSQPRLGAYLVRYSTVFQAK